MSIDDPAAQKAPEGAAVLDSQPSERPAPTAAPEPVSTSLPPQIEDFDTLIAKDVGNFVELGNKIGGLVAEQVGYLKLEKLAKSADHSSVS